MFPSFLFRFIPPETAHALVLSFLKKGGGRFFSVSAPSSLAVEAFGLSFPNPLGMAAGFDKNGEVPDALCALGFGFAEIGSVTPLPQVGNPCPRLFRLWQDQAIINRLGFNNQGHVCVASRLQKRSQKNGILGVNLGANRDSPDRLQDYLKGMEVFQPFASYFTVNVSSPNTEGLRALQNPENLKILLQNILVLKQEMADQGRLLPPVLLKLAPDLEHHLLSEIAEVCLSYAVSGVILSNTTLERPSTLRSKEKSEKGGLSGKPLFELATRRLAQFHKATLGQIPLIGVGGIFDGETAWQKITAGATLIQLYSALIFRGTPLIAEIFSTLEMRLKEKGWTHLSQAVGSDRERWV